MTAHQYAVLVYFLRRYWKIYVPISSLCLTVAFLETVNLAVLLPILNEMLAGGATGAVGLVGSALDQLLNLSPFPDRMASACAILVILAPVKGFLSVLMEYLIGRGSGKVLYDAKKQILHKYARAPYSFFLESKQGELIYQAFTAPNKLSFVMTRLPQLLVEVTRVAAILVLLALTHLKATLGLLAISLLMHGLVSLVTRNASYSLGRERVETDAAQSSLLQELFSGIKQISVFGVKQRWLDAFDQANQRFCELFTRDHALLAVPRSLIETLTVCALFGALLYGRLVYPDNLSTLLPVAGVFCMALLKILPALSILGRCRIEVQGALPNLEGIYTVLHAPIKEPSSGSRAFHGLRGGICLRGVRFAYPTRGELLRGLDLEIPKGRTTAIVGGSGSGKTTIINLLLGLYRPSSGQVLVDDVPLEELDSESYLRRVALVSQDTCLLHATISENIAFGRPGFTEQDIRRAAKVAHAHEFIEQLPDGYLTVVGERGMKLSGGQQQRLAIARAILGNPDILLFDEATSALDNVSEVAVQGAIREASQGKTVVQVAHRLSSIQSADKIVVLHGGLAEEEGTHEELLQKRGRYAQLHSAG